MIQKLGDSRRNINIPKVWRREFGEAFANTLLAVNAAPGTLISTSRTVTLYEPSYIRVNAKCAMFAEDNVQYWGELYIYEGAGGVTLRDYNYATCQNTGAPATDERDGCNVLYDALYAVGSYVFEIRARGAVANKVTAMSNFWTIDVCRD
jgi:hypothetical protein